MGAMRLPLSFALIAALVGSASLSIAAAPKSPLGQWMKPNMSAPLAGNDFGALKKAFDTVASKVPAGDYPQWGSIAQGGAAAAAKSDLAGVKGACKGCHDAYKAKYLKEHATTPYP